MENPCFECSTSGEYCGPDYNCDKINKYKVLKGEKSYHDRVWEGVLRGSTLEGVLDGSS